MTVHLQIWTAILFVYVGLPLAWASVALHLVTPWHKTEMGRHLLAYATVIAAIMSFAAVRWFWFRTKPFPDGVQVLQFSIYLDLMAVMAWRVALQYRALRSRK